MNSPAAQDLTWNKRLKQLRTRLELNQTQMADRLGITREWLSALETGKEKVGDLLVYKIKEIENSLNTGEHSVGEPGAPYNSSNKPLEIRRDVGSSVKVNTAFRPATGEPTPDDCLSYLRAYLDEARLVPGMVGHTLIELRDRFPIDKVRRMREAHDANTH